MAEFSAASLEWTGRIAKEERKRHGVYFTPATFRRQLWTRLPGDMQPARCLEPSLGSGEFIDDGLVRFPSAMWRGHELNAGMATSARERLAADIVEGDFLAAAPPPDWRHATDLVVGNPPYCVAPRAAVPTDLLPYVTGRANMYALFIARLLLDWLKPDGGIMALVLPKNFLTTSYYDKVRALLTERCRLIAVEHLEGGAWMDTDQETILVVAQTCTTPLTDAPHVVREGGRVWLCCGAGGSLRPPNTTTLKALGFAVKTGTVVWNQVKGHLRDAGDNDATLLIYASNVTKDGKIVLQRSMRNGKKQYVSAAGVDKPRMTGPFILLQRGYGNAAYALSPALVTAEDAPCYVENHLNVAIPVTDAARARVPWVMGRLVDERTKAWIREWCSKGALSKTELEEMVPIFMD